MKNIEELSRGAGILMAVNSLPSDYGIGTMGKAAYSFVDLLADLKMRYWQILPIGPISYGNSPYQPISAFAGNNYLIDLDELAALGLLKPEEIRSYDWGNDIRDIDYTNMYNNRIRVLRTAFERFDRDDRDYAAFVKDNSYWLDDYALFRAIRELHNDREWTSWEQGLKDREKQALDEFREEYGDVVDFYKFCQYMFHMQWNRLHDYAAGRGVMIIGDISLYVAHDSADVWAHREIFRLNEDGTPALVSAMPSDEFSPKGQIWGSPVYDWETMDSDDFSWWRSRLRKACEQFDVVRLDHFIGAVKYYAVSPGTGLSESGRWYKGPSRRFMEAVSESMGEVSLIVDDAGPRTVVPGVKKLVDKWRLTCSRILVFGWDKGNDNDNLPHNYKTSNIAVYTTTHDTETMSGYIASHATLASHASLASQTTLAVREKNEALDYMSRYLNVDIMGDVSESGKVTGLSDESIRALTDGNIRLAYSSAANLAIIPIQDIFGLGNEARMNAPATTFGNWQWRVGTHTISDERREWLVDLAFIYRR